ncbi:MAG: hypothetical protein AAGA56_08205 [Myxococcota bacterium]
MMEEGLRFGARWWLAPGLAFALHVGCGDSATTDDATTGDETSSTAEGGGGTSTGSLACPAVADGGEAAPSSGTGQVAWVEEIPVLRGVSAAGSPQGGVVVAGTGVSDGSALSLGPHEVYDGTENLSLAAVARMDEEGTFAWAQGIIPTSADVTWSPPLTVAGTAQGALVAMAIDRAVTVGTTTYNETGASTLLLLHIGSEGVIWSATFGAAVPTDFVMRANAAGRTAFALRYDAAVDLGGGARDCTNVVLAVDADGGRQFDRCAAVGEEFPLVEGIDITDDGDVVLSAFPPAEYDVGLGPMSIDSSRGASVLFRMDGLTGATEWATVFSGAYAQHPTVDPMGRIHVAGNVPGLVPDVALGRAPLGECAVDPGFAHHVTQLSPEGDWVRSTFVGDRGPMSATADGRLYIVPGGVDAFAPGLPSMSRQRVVAFDADGAIAWQQTFPEDSVQLRVSMVDGGDRPFVLMGLNGTLSLEGGESVTGEGFAPFIASLTP